MKKLLFISLTMFISEIMIAQSTEVSIPGSQTKTFNSSIVKGQEYVLQISLPADYATSNKKYPVVYLMDSQWDFPLMVALYGQQYYDGFVPEMIIVGITWGGIHPNPDSLRTRDYTPTNEKSFPQSGGADKFLSVIKNEVFPLVEKNYRVDANDKTLIGCSLGGLFTIYSLFTHPEMFNRYVAASPAFSWGNNVLRTYGKQYFQRNKNPKGKLFMCVGGVELAVPEYEKFVSFLKGWRYPGLEIESQILDNTGHSGTKGIGYEKGLQFVFARPSIHLEPAVLAQYTGTYKMDDGREINIKSEDGSLVGYASGTKFNLFAASKTDFYTKAFFLNIHFETDAMGKVSGFQLVQYASHHSVKKINNK